MNLIFIGAFGLAGIFARYFIGLSVSRFYPSPFPAGIFFINIIGAFLVGVIYVVAIERSLIAEELRLGIVVGFLGGFTTFSSYCLDTARLLEEGEFLHAALYWCLSPVVGLIATFAGFFLMLCHLAVPGNILKMQFDAVRADQLEIDTLFVVPEILCRGPAWIPD